VPVASGMAGSSGYSVTGSNCNVKRALPHVSSMRDASHAMLTGLAGNDRAMSASSRPETSATPSSSTVAGTVIFAEVS